MSHRALLEKYLHDNGVAVGEAFATLVRMLWNTNTEIFETHIIDDHGETPNAQPVQVIIYTKGGAPRAKEIADTPFDDLTRRVEETGCSPSSSTH